MASVAQNASTNRLRKLEGLGQSVWQDNITRRQLQTGQLKQLVEEDGISGVTSNPSIFEKAIGSGGEYDGAIRQLLGEGQEAPAILDALMLEDIRSTADVLRPTWEATGHRDGFVSIEVAPNLARNTEETITEARRLWQAVGRPNVMVKIPGTVEGVPAIRRCLSEGININVTLLFSLDHYEAVAWAFIEAMEARVKAGLPVRDLASVASFFVSRVDTIVDKTLRGRIEASTSDTERAQLESLLGTIAIANAKLAYARFEEIFSSANPRFAALAPQGAQVQRPLWASTSMKDPKRRDVLYVEELIAEQTVNTMPPQTIDAFRDHGVVRGLTAKENVDAARARIQLLADLNISFEELTDELENDGVRLFEEAFNKLLVETAHKVEELRSTPATR
ncbi:MAG: transaldolase [Chloroflexi bacterium]|nr:transaldolase [Chloroflexota bacterium]